MRHILIVNPAAGRENSLGKVTAEAAEVFGARGEDHEIYVTRCRMDAARYIHEAAACSREELRIYACGGDGTLNECAGAAAGLAHVAVTHYPCGTGNDFIRTFGDEQDRFRSLAELADGEVRPLDIMRCGDRCSLNICSVGVDARIGADVHKYSGLPLIGGAAGYVVSTAVHFFRGLSSPMRITAGGQVFDGDMTLVCACNGRYYGGGFNPVPDARPDDGLLDILVVPGITRRIFARVIVPYARGHYRNYPQYLTHIRSDRLRIEAEEPFIVNLDGESVRRKTLDIEISAGGLRFLVPRGMKFFEEKDSRETCEIE
ncbi:MAG: diacylglycerol kinase family lipid kinase [Eubacteriales bacterium]|nr:diacylglycerol kinase family lipid kinase [Eubacteriales bacterium]